MAPQHVDQFVVLCWELGTVGLSESDHERDRLEIYFHSDKADAERVETLCRRASSHGLQIKLLEDSVIVSRAEDWLDGFREHFKGFRVGNKFWIHPPWEAPSETREINISIEPAAAFGTGTHESTQLCLQGLEEIAEPPRSILDVGTGSGILATAAAKLWRGARILAIDNDSNAALAARRTFAANSALKPVVLAAEPASLRFRFDLVMANLTRPILEAEAPALAGLCGKEILLSGFTEREESTVRAVFDRHGPWAAPITCRLRGWSCLRLQRVDG